MNNRQFCCGKGIAFVLLMGVLPCTMAVEGDQTSLVGKRDPFWPIGYVPKNLVEKKEPVEQVTKEPVVGSWSLAMKTIVINGVSSRSDNDFFAVINGKIRSVGDSVSVTYGDAVYTWSVDSIKPPNSVKLRRLSVQ